MGILGITNRTENFKTAKTFAPFLVEDEASLAKRADLIKRLGETPPSDHSKIGLELFWKGMRDKLEYGQRHYDPERAAPWIEFYRNHFHDLQDKVANYEGFQELQPCNYRVDDADQQKSFYNSLLNTEIDIVLETPNHLYIGEAKDESGFHASSKLVLVHQLIRQYVLAKTLVSLTSEKKVVPFIVRQESKVSQEEKAQVSFMIEEMKVLKPSNILTWEQIDAIAKGQRR